MMTPMAQQSTGRPYRCRPTTSGAAYIVPIGSSVSGLTRPGTSHIHSLGTSFPPTQSHSLKVVSHPAPATPLLAQVLRGPTGLLDEAIL